MQTGTLYLLGRSAVIRPEDGKEVVVEMLAIDTDTDYDDFVKVDGVRMMNGVPEWAMKGYRDALHYRTQVNKEVAREWLK